MSMTDRFVPIVPLDGLNEFNPFHFSLIIDQGEELSEVVIASKDQLFVRISRHVVPYEVAYDYKVTKEQVELKIYYGQGVLIDKEFTYALPIIYNDFVIEGYPTATTPTGSNFSVIKKPILVTIL